MPSANNATIWSMGELVIRVSSVLHACIPHTLPLAAEVPHVVSWHRLQYGNMLTSYVHATWLLLFVCLCVCVPRSPPQLPWCPRWHCGCLHYGDTYVGCDTQYVKQLPVLKQPQNTVVVSSPPPPAPQAPPAALVPQVVRICEAAATPLMGSVRVSRSLQENAAITLGRTAMVCPDQVRLTIFGDVCVGCEVQGGVQGELQGAGPG
jgi:hypothetical protein